MTGVTGGLGAHALQEIASHPGNRTIIGARGYTRSVPPGVEILPLDLASLASVREFVAALETILGGSSIDVLVLNAGVHNSRAAKRSADGYELTFAVNHLAHYLLARLLLPRLASGARLIVTTSNTHDPAITWMAPRTLVPQALAHPIKSGIGTGIRAYTASKLCNMLTAQSFAMLDETVSRRIAVVAFNPGLTGGSSGRESSPVARALVRVLMHTVFRVIGIFRPEFVMNSAKHSGKALAAVALGTLAPPPGRNYVSLVRGKPTFPAPSELAQSLTVQAALWRESAAMVGLP